MRRFIALFAIFGSLSTSANADVGVILELRDPEPPFKTCDVALGFETFGAKYTRVLLRYDVYVKGKKSRTCTASWAAKDRMIDSSCTTLPGLDYPCADVTKIRPTGVDCRDAKDGHVECGTLKIGGDKVFTFKK